MNYQELNEKLKSIFVVDENKIQNSTLKVRGLPFLKLRDILISNGKIYFEDLDNQIYVATVKGGFLNRSFACVALALKDEHLLLSVYSKEGLINQHTCEGVVNELKKHIKAYIEE